MGKKSKDILIILLVIVVCIAIRIPIEKIDVIETGLLQDPDSFLYARLANEFSETPISKWTFYTYRSVDPIMNTIDSEKDPFTTNLLPIVAALVSKVFRFVPLDVIVYFLSTFVASLAVLPIYFFVAKRTSEKYGALAALFAGLTPSYLIHTVSGFFDTDSFILLFASIIMLCIIESFYVNDEKKQLVLCSIELIASILFSVTWEAFYVYILLACFIVAVNVLVIRRKHLKTHIRIPLITSAVLIAFCVAKSFDAADGSLGRTIGSFFNDGNWPKESKFIGELVAPVLITGDGFDVVENGLINRLGGAPFGLLLILALWSTFRYFYRIIKKDELSLEDLSSFDILIWLLVTLPIVAFGNRFVQLCALPVTILVGLFLGRYNEKKDFFAIKKDLIVLVISILVFGSVRAISFLLAILIAVLVLLFGNSIKRIRSNTIFVTLTILSVICMAVSGHKYAITRDYVSSDHMDMSRYIVQNLPHDAAIVTSWDYGYYYQYATEHLVVADGGIYDGAYFYWLSNIFTTDDPKLSKGIAKMLQGGSIEAVRIVQQKTGNEKETANLLKDILIHEKNDARNLLISKYNYSVAEAEELIQYSHPEIDAPVYLVVSKDMMKVLTSIGYFGLWDFENGISLQTYYNVDTDSFVFPKELANSIVVRLFEGKSIKGFEKLYENDTVSIFEFS